MTLAQYHIQNHAHRTLCDLMLHDDPALLKEYFTQLRQCEASYCIDTRQFSGLYSTAHSRGRRASYADFCQNLILLAQNFDLVLSDRNETLNLGLSVDSTHAETIRYFQYTMLISLWVHFVDNREWEEAFFLIWGQYSKQTAFSFANSSAENRMFAQMVTEVTYDRTHLGADRINWLLRHQYPFNKSFLRTGNSGFMASRSVISFRGKKLNLLFDPDNLFYICISHVPKHKRLLAWVTSRADSDMLLTNAILIQLYSKPIRSQDYGVFAPLFASIKDLDYFLKVLEGAQALSDKALRDYGLALDVLHTVYPKHLKIQALRDKVMAQCTFAALKGSKV